MRSSTSPICSARRDRLELALGQLEREVEVALVAGVDDRRQRPVADEQPADRLDRALRGRQADAVRARVAQRLEPLEREREVRAALVARDRVDLVDDDRLDRAQRVAAARARDQQVERLGRGDHEARRLAQHRGALASSVVSPVRTADPRSSGASSPSSAAIVGDLARAAARGSRRCRPPAPSAARRRRHARCRRSARRPRARGRAGRCTRGTRRASCPSRWARRSACRRPRRCAASRRAAARSARRGSAAGTTCRPRDGTRRRAPARNPR